MRVPVLPPDVPRPLDQELLAWAAGFFDGEGTTIARTDRRRPGYLRLNVSVGQADAVGVPAVLVKFQRAMLGLGTIYREDDTLYRWRAMGRLGAEISVALLWPYLSVVKRRQAASALESLAALAASGSYRTRAARYRPQYSGHGAEGGEVNDQRLRLAWAAGFLDAEGCFGVTRLPARKDGTTGLRVRVSASQHGEPGVPAEVLLRLRDAVGVGHLERHGEIDDFKWVVTGEERVSAVLELLRPWLGAVKVEQAVRSLAAHHDSRVRGTSERCIRGHTYDGLYVRPDGTIHHLCRTCDRLREATQGDDGRRLADERFRYAA